MFKQYKQRCIFITGVEGSGSTFIAQSINKVLNNDSLWNGRGFNCCNSGECGKNNNYILPCSEQPHLVCHRSLPFNLDPIWPPIFEWLEIYDCYFVICTRDQSISKLSTQRRFNRTEQELHNFNIKARENIKLILESNSKYLIWSYETFLFLKEDYIKLLYKFLNVDSDYLPGIIDNNQRYVSNGPV